jgi:hypothetical protein
MGKLSEKDFIQDNLRKNPFPAWFWLFVVAAVACIAWGLGSFYRFDINSQTSVAPFLQVTNRQMSLFLWQFPSEMRAHIGSGKSSYLPGFQYVDKVSIEPGFADVYVEAPPELLFLYHTWDRLISNDFSTRPIPPVEFQEFLSYCEEWQPANWPKAPEGYVELVKELKNTQEKDLQVLSRAALPMVVRQAFQGWKNYMKEGSAINALNPSFEEMSGFLERYPNYARNFWRNIYPEYLKSYVDEAREGVVGQDELEPFLKVAFYNYSKSYYVVTKPSS